MSKETCPDCGAVYKNDLNCETVFNNFLDLEFTNVEYGAVHMLTVACYMIQHGLYSDESLIWIEKRLCDYLEKGVMAENIRQQAAIEIGQDKRNWMVNRRSGDPQPKKIPWSMTIVDVALQYQDSASYRDLVQQWATSILKEMGPLLSKTVG